MTHINIKKIKTISCNDINCVAEYKSQTRLPAIVKKTDCDDLLRYHMPTHWKHRAELLNMTCDDNACIMTYRNTIYTDIKHKHHIKLA